MPRTFPRARADLTLVHMDDECVVYDERSGDLHHLNATATVVFDLCDGAATISELVASLSAAFGVPEAEVDLQVRALIRRFRRAQLLEPAGESLRRVRVGT